MIKRNINAGMPDKLNEKKDYFSWQKNNRKKRRKRAHKTIKNICARTAFCAMKTSISCYAAFHSFFLFFSSICDIALSLYRDCTSSCSSFSEKTIYVTVRKVQKFKIVRLWVEQKTMKNVSVTGC